jgi:predicted RNA-binding Zn-ribbon protein involved in translation (DUF1610 family)
MDIREIETMLTKLQKVGIATCESCNIQIKFSEIETFNGTYLCPKCLKNIVWKPEGVVELPS